MTLSQRLFPGYRSLLLVALAGLTSVSTAQAQQEGVAFEPREFISGENKLLYQIHVPKPLEEGKKYPLIVYLHGAGGRGNDNKAQMGTDWYSTFINGEGGEEAILVAPQFPRRPGRRRDGPRQNNPDRAEEPRLVDTMDLLVELLKQLDQDLPIDPQRRYLTGVSMGGGNTYRLLRKQPKYFAAAAPMCGRFSDSDLEPLTDVKFWIFHGDKDRSISVESSRRAVKAIREAGGDVRYTEYPDMGHECWLKAYKDKELTVWLFSQRRE